MFFDEIKKGVEANGCDVVSVMMGREGNMQHAVVLAARQSDNSWITWASAKEDGHPWNGLFWGHYDFKDHPEAVDDFTVRVERTATGWTDIRLVEADGRVVMGGPVFDEFSTTKC